MEHRPKTSKNLAEILSSISRRTPQSVSISCTCLVLAKMSFNSLTGITSNAAPLSCLFGIVCRCDKSLTFHYFFLFYIVRNFDSSFATIIVITSSELEPAHGLGRATRPTSNRAEPAENRRAQRRHRLGRPPRIPLSNSHGRLRSGVDLSGRASREHIVVFDF